jgi:hypothetical protein
MIAILKWLYLVALGLWLGSIVFFSFAVAPQVFGVLPRPDAGRVVSAIFPVYYSVGYACGGVMLVAAILLRGNASAPRGAWSLSAALAGLMLAVTLYAGLIVQPRAHTLRNAMLAAPDVEAAKIEFDELHRRAVQLNGSVLFGVLVLTALTANRLRV